MPKNIKADLQQLLNDGILDLKDTIQIQREENPEAPLPDIDHRPIVNWYFKDYIMQDMFSHRLATSEQDLLETKQLQRTYLAVSRSLVPITVEGCLAELNHYS